MENWTDKYLGIPFLARGRGFNGCDCAGLVKLVYEHELGLMPTDFKEYETADFKGSGGYAKLGAGAESLMNEWQVIDSPRVFDLCRFRVGCAPCHAGVYAGQGRFLHVDETTKAALLESLSGLAWTRRFVEFRRFKGFQGASRGFKGV